MFNPHLPNAPTSTPARPRRLLRRLGWLIALSLTVIPVALIYAAALGSPLTLGTAPVNRVIQGAAANDNLGAQVVAGNPTSSALHAAGDVNGDGFADFLVGASRVGFTEIPNDPEPSIKISRGAAYLIFGSASGPPDPLDLANLGTNGIVFNGLGVDHQAGFSVSGAGDVNGDGLADLLIGAPYAGANGTAYLIFGRTDWTTPPTLATADVTFTGPAAGDLAGWAVSIVGDVNSDGYADILIGAPNVNGFEGAAYVILGRVDWSSPPTLAEPDATFTGVAAGGGLGTAVSGAGDVNGDGFADLLIAAPYVTPGGGLDFAGRTYLVFGRANWIAPIDLADLGSTGVVFDGVTIYESAGIALSSAGDVNGDGLADILIGARLSNLLAPDSYAGAAYLVFGRTTGWPNTPTFLNNLGADGVVILGVAQYDQAGYSVRGAGDVDGDGLDDILIGAPFGTPAFANKGEAYLIFGRTSAWISPIDLNTLTSPTGAVLRGAADGDRAGTVVAGLGDLNGDGFADLAVAAPGADPAGRADAGAVYLLLGANFNTPTAQIGTAGNETLTGTAGADVINGRGGNDTLVGNGGADVLIGGAGDDILAISDATFARIDGGLGKDTLRLDGTDMELDLLGNSPSEQARRITGIEVIDMRGSGNNTLQLDRQTLLNLSPTSNTLRVRGDVTDIVRFPSSEFIAADNEVIDTVTYNRYTGGAAVLLIENPVPTDVSLTSFTLSQASDGSVTLFWSTASERTISGFRLWRGPSPVRAEATLLFEDPIPGDGDSLTGADYSWSDPTAPAIPSFYWLEVVNTDDSRTEYGPISTVAEVTRSNQFIFLPLIQH
ncbi:MAG: hypothetical protein AB4911_04650 [Oscillochloridaceae bacterium umkhey_bin13]